MGGRGLLLDCRWRSEIKVQETLFIASCTHSMVNLSRRSLGASWMVRLDGKWRNTSPPRKKYNAFLFFPSEKPHPKQHLTFEPTSVSSASQRKDPQNYRKRFEILSLASDAPANSLPQPASGLEGDYQHLCECRMRYCLCRGEARAATPGTSHMASNCSNTAPSSRTLR